MPDVLPIGTIRVRIRRRKPYARRPEYYRVIKISDSGPTYLQWMAYARWWWQTHRGAIPDGMRVCHRDGDSMNDDPQNLVLLTLSDNAYLSQQRMSATQLERAERNRLAGIRRVNCQRSLAARISGRLFASQWYLIDHASRTVSGPHGKKRHLAYAPLDLARPPLAGTLDLAWLPLLLGFGQYRSTPALLLAGLCQLGQATTPVLVELAQELAERAGFGDRVGWHANKTATALAALERAGLVESHRVGKCHKMRRITALGRAARGPVYDVAALKGLRAQEYLDQGYRYCPVLLEKS